MYRGMNSFKQKKHRPEIVSLVLKPMMPNLDLIPNRSFDLHQKCYLNQPVYSFLVSTNEVTGHMRPPPPPPEEKEAVCMIKPVPFPSPQKRRRPGLKLILSFANCSPAQLFL